MQKYKYLWRNEAFYIETSQTTLYFNTVSILSDRIFHHFSPSHLENSFFYLNFAATIEYKS